MSFLLEYMAKPAISRPDLLAAKKYYAEYLPRRLCAFRPKNRRILIKRSVLRRPPARHAEHRQRRKVGRAQAPPGQRRRHRAVDPGALVGPRQGKEDPPGSGKYPEPKWLGMIQHDMMMFDHGMPRADGTVSKEQRPEADVNIEFQSNSKMADASQKLAWILKTANEKYATDYPAQVGSHMTNTDSGPFIDLIAAISLRENERGTQIGAGWDPQWHQPTDVFATYSDKDFRLGLNAAQTTLGAVGGLIGATIRK